MDDAKASNGGVQGRDDLSVVWRTELRRRKLTLDAGRGPKHRIGGRKKQPVLLYGRWLERDYMTDSSIYGQEFYAFPDLDPAIEAVRLSDILQARRKIYLKPGARVRPNRITPRRSLGSGSGTKFNLTDGVVVGYVPASNNYREDERRYGRTK